MCVENYKKKQKGPLFDKTKAMHFIVLLHRRNEDDDINDHIPHYLWKWPTVFPLEALKYAL